MRLFRNIFILLACVVYAHGGQMIVTMKSGERLIGEVSADSSETNLLLESPLLGQLALPKAQILKQEPHASEQAAPQTPVLGEFHQNESKGKTIPLTEEEMALVQEDSLLDKLFQLKTPESWSGNLRFGLDLSDGDSKWSQLYAKGNLVIDPPQSRNYYRFTGSYTYRTTDRTTQRQVMQGEETITETVTETVKLTDRYDANFTFRRDVSERFFLQNSIGWRVDTIKGIDREIQELIGLGFRLEPTERINFIFGGGGGIEDYDPEFEDTRAGLHPVANVFQELTWQPFERATFAQEFNYFINPEHSEQYNYVLSASFRYRLTDLLGFEVSYDKNFDNDVGNGSVKDDSRWRNAIIVYF